MAGCAKVLSMCIHARWLRYLSVVAAMAMVLLCGAANATPDRYYPGLPKLKGNTVPGAGVDTLSFAKSVQQWIKIDDMRVAADTVTKTAPGVPGQVSNLTIHVDTYAVDNAHDMPQTYGEFPETRIRTVAFGSVPAEATVHVSQVRDAEGLPEPITVDSTDVQWDPGYGPFASTIPGRYDVISDATVDGRVEVRVSDVVVDGVRVEVGDNCRAQRPAHLVATGEGYVAEAYPAPPGVDPLTWVPPGKYHSLRGGLITGTISIPAFAGCGLGGENLSPLVTAIASGDDFPTQIHQDRIGSLCFNKFSFNLDISDCAWPDIPIPARK